MSLYDILGVAADATQAAIKAAFRSLAQKNHPDKAGGSKERMQDIQKAYDILSDEARRARYDESGATDQPPTPRDLAVAELAKLVAAMMEHLDKGEGDDLDHNSPIDAVRQQVHGFLRDGAKAQVQLARVIVQHRKALMRLRHKIAAHDTMSEILNGLISQASKIMEKNEAHLGTYRAVLDILAEYEYEAEPKVREAPKPMTLQDLFNQMHKT